MSSSTPYSFSPFDSGSFFTFRFLPFLYFLTRNFFHLKAVWFFLFFVLRGFLVFNAFLICISLIRPITLFFGLFVPIYLKSGARFFFFFFFPPPLSFCLLRFDFFGSSIFTF